MIHRTIKTSASANVYPLEGSKHHPSRTRFVAVGMVSLLFAFCGMVSNAGAAYPKEAVEVVVPQDSSQDIPTAAGTLRVGSVNLKKCSDVNNAWCGELSVPLDWADPTAGKILLGFEWYPARRAAQGTIVAVDGGPGYSSTANRKPVQALFWPLLELQNLLLVDNRGTGRSEAIRCEALQSFRSGQPRAMYLSAAKDCGTQLDGTFKKPDGSFVRASELFGTANAARDLAAVINALGVAPVDLYGDSYGTYFAQTFASRYPSLLRSVTLDSAYPLIDNDPWFRSGIRAMRNAFNLVCARSADCVAAGGNGWRDISKLAAVVRQTPLTGTFRNADGNLQERTLDVAALLSLIQAAGNEPGIYRDLSAAARAWLENGDKLPLIRLMVETLPPNDSGPVRTFSTGLFIATSCTDYRQLFDKSSSRSQREAEFQQAIAALPAATFAPFTVQEWAFSAPGNFDTSTFDSCILWPQPLRNDPPLTIQPPLVPSNLPVLMLAGDLDTVTPLEDARTTAEQLGLSARLVEIENNLHVTALDDSFACASNIVRAFVKQPGSLHALDTSCATQTVEIRAVGAFVRRMADIRGAQAESGNTADLKGLKLAAVATATVGDALFRYNNLPGISGVGLRGGTYRLLDSSIDTVQKLKLEDARWTEDVRVNGQVTQKTDTGLVKAEVHVDGPDGQSASLTIVWNDDERNAMTRITGTVNGEQLVASLAAP